MRTRYTFRHSLVHAGGWDLSSFPRRCSSACNTTHAATTRHLLPVHHTAVAFYHYRRTLYIGSCAIRHSTHYPLLPPTTIPPTRLSLFSPLLPGCGGRTLNKTLGAPVGGLVSWTDSLDIDRTGEGRILPADGVSTGVSGWFAWFRIIMWFGRA